MKGNILFFQESISLGDGGVPRVSDVISNELTNRGYRCYFVFSTNDNEDYPSDIKIQVNPKDRQRSEAAVQQFIHANEINFLVCQNAYDDGYIEIFRLVRLRYPHIPFICFLHAAPDYWRIVHRPGSDLFQYKFLIHTLKNIAKSIVYPFYNPYVRKMKSLYSICDKFVLLSNSFKDSFEKLCGSDSNNKKLIVIPNPLTFENFATENDIDQKERIVLIVSRLDEDQKRISIALKIWLSVCEVGDNSWKLYIVGGGPDENFYRQFVESNGLSNVNFIGQQRDVIEFYKKASIFMMTSIWEGLPMSLLEAQQCGVVPVAFNNFSAVHDIITSGKNGYIVGNSDLKGFVDKLGILMNDDRKRSDMAINAVQDSRRFHIKEIVNKWEYALTHIKV